MKVLAAAPRALTPLALIAAALAIVVPSAAVASRSDLLLALLVLVTALGISWSELAGLRRHAGAVAALSVAPLIALAAAAWLVGRLFGGETRDGLLAVGLSSSEVASVGLVALAGADATVALGAVTGSLVLSALAGPLTIAWLAGQPGRGAGGGAGAGGSHLLGRFALVVIVPLVVGVAIRTLAPAATWLRARDAQREGLAALAVVALVYAALSGVGGAGAARLGSAVAASLAFLVVSAALGELWRRRSTAAGAAATAVPGALAIGMRDFAVAAALASQAFGSAAGVVPGVYGVLMLLGGSAVAGALGRDRARRMDGQAAQPGSG